MVFSDILAPSSILVPLPAASREAAISALVEALNLPTTADRDQLKAAILAREAIGSTGLGNGIAIPHARSPRLTSPRLSIGRTAAPIEFNAADGKPVGLFFLLAVPEANPTSHLKALAALSRIASDKKLLRGLMRASSAGELLQLVADLPI
ncbi:MAG: PTS sugar transporter subunit IIA [Elusimicrobia bacterium]|nr:PTS sugar transporter subunit IIA [Elusimicrobiota bacterium]MDE2237173.1 PTS sugar transporter subunit IIA [Elusimicrobiota bacterium]MDE2425526.1 PTS sugar transporter subunit IIA [Elusimicrobiota bacterium]